MTVSDCSNCLLRRNALGPSFGVMKILPCPRPISVDRRFRPWRRFGRLAASFALMVLVTACATTPYQDSVNPTPGEHLAAMDHADPKAGAAAAALGRVARATFQAGDLGSAINIYRRALTLTPNDPEMLVGLGEVLVATRAPEEARVPLARAVEVDPENVRARRILGKALIRLGQSALAIDQFRAALAIRAEPSLYNGLGVAHDGLNDQDSAEKAYRAGLALDPENAALTANLALSLALHGRMEEGIALLAPTLEAGRSTSRGRHNLALIYGLAGRHDDARALLAMDLPPQQIENNIAWYELLAGVDAPSRRGMVLGLTTDPS